MKEKIRKAIEAAEARSALKGISTESVIRPTTPAARVAAISQQKPMPTPKLKAGPIHAWGHDFAVKLVPFNPPNLKAIISYADEEIGFIHSEVSPGALRWVYSTMNDEVLGSDQKRDPSNAIGQLFDRIISEPIRQAEATARCAGQPYIPPVVIDGVTFTFDQGEVVKFHSGNVRVNHHVSFLGTFDFDTIYQFRKGVKSSLGRNQERCLISFFNDNQDEYTGHLDAGVNKYYKWETGVPLEVILRWAHMHTMFLNIRCMRELSTFHRSITLLIDRGEKLFSRNTYRELCGFLPVRSDKYKIYIQTKERFEDRMYLPPTDHYKLVFTGDAEAAIGEFTREGLYRYEYECVLLLNERDELVAYNAANHVTSRYYGHWESIFPDALWTYQTHMEEDMFKQFRQQKHPVEQGHPNASKPN